MFHAVLPGPNTRQNMIVIFMFIIVRHLLQLIQHTKSMSFIIQFSTLSSLAQMSARILSPNKSWGHRDSSVVPRNFVLPFSSLFDLFQFSYSLFVLFFIYFIYILYLFYLLCIIVFIYLFIYLSFIYFCLFYVFYLFYLCI